MAAASPCKTGIHSVDLSTTVFPEGCHGALRLRCHNKEAFPAVGNPTWRRLQSCCRKFPTTTAAVFVTCIVARTSLQQSVANRFTSSRRRAWGQFGKETVSGVAFPENYEELIGQAQDAVALALSAGLSLMEVEFPPNGIESVAGDSDGSTEMNRNTSFLRDFCELFTRQGRGERTRVFFPDAGELELAVMGAGLNPGIGQWEIAATFDDAPFRLDYLGADSPLSEMSYKMMGYAGTQTKKRAVTDLVRPDDEVFVVGYPSDSANEMLLVQELHASPLRQPGVPVIIFNGQLDDVRSGFYPKLFSPKLHKYTRGRVCVCVCVWGRAERFCKNKISLLSLSGRSIYSPAQAGEGKSLVVRRSTCAPSSLLQKEFVPMIETAYYIHNFKGSRPGVLFRAYPGPWQVFKREYDGTVQDCIYESDSRPSLKDVALEILAR